MVAPHGVRAGSLGGRLESRPERIGDSRKLAIRGLAPVIAAEMTAESVLPCVLIRPAASLGWLIDIQ